jgi:ribonuclease HI
MISIHKYFKVIKNSNEEVSEKVSEEIPSKKITIIYSDGGTINNGSKNAIGGIGVYNETDNLKYSEKIIYKTFNKPVTNNICELYAIQYAIDNYSNKDKTLKIITDSLYCVNIFTKWASNWKINNWKKRDNKPIQNLDMIKYIYHKVCKNKIVFQHCNSHLTEPIDKNTIQHKIWEGNDIADKLATKAIHS